MTIYITPHFHYDVAYLRTFEQYLPLCFDNLREAVRIMDAEPEYRFLIEQPILLEEFRTRCPEEFAQLRACADRGQVEVACGMWSMPDMNFPSGESLVRQALVGKGWVREHLGLDVSTCWIADCWGHPASLPQILRHCGYNAYAFSRGMRPELQRSDFRWRGLDGTEILTHWLAIGYGPLLFPDVTHVENLLEQDVTHAGEGQLLNLVERIRPALSTEHVLIGNGGDFARPQAGGPALVRRWREMGHEVRFAATPEYFQAVGECDLPVVAGEFNPLFSGAYGSRIAIKQANRRLEYLCLALERAAAVAPAATDAAEWLPVYWKTALKNQFHDISSGTIIDAANEQVMADYRAALAGAGRVLARTLSGAFGESWAPAPLTPQTWGEPSAGRPDSPRNWGAGGAAGSEWDSPDTPRTGPAGGTGDTHVALFNPSVFPRREVVALPWGDASVMDGESVLTGQPDRLLVGGGTLVDVTLAPMEVKVLRRADAPTAPDVSPVDGGPFLLDNGILRVTVAQDGTLTSVVDARTGREYVDPARPYWGELVYRNDNGDLWLLDKGPLDGGGLASRLTDQTVHDPYARSQDPLVNANPVCQHGPKRSVELLENGPLRWSVKVTGSLGFWRNRVEFSTEITLRRGSRRIDFETRIVPAGRHFRLHACFPTALHGGRIRHEVAFGIQERDERLYAAQNWIDLAGDDYGVCLLNAGIPGNMACDGVLSLLLFRSAAMEYKGESVGAFYDGVPHTFRYAALPFEASDEGYLPHREGEALNLPFAVAPCAEARTQVTPCLEVTPANVHVSAFYRSGEHLVLRVYEAAGRACEATLRLPDGIGACREADGLEQPGEILPMAGGTVRVPMRAFEIRTFLLGG